MCATMPHCLMGDDSHISLLFVWEQSTLSQFSRRLTEFIGSILNKEASLTFWLSSRGMRVRHLLSVVRVPCLLRQHDSFWSRVLQVELVMAEHQALTAVLPPPLWRALGHVRLQEQLAPQKVGHTTSLQNECIVWTVLSVYTGSSC